MKHHAEFNPSPKPDIATLSRMLRPTSRLRGFKRVEIRTQLIKAQLNQGLIKSEWQR